MENINEVVKKITEIKDSLSTKKMREWSGGAISGAILELAILKINLGIYIAEQEEKFYQLEKERKLEEIKIYRDERMKDVSQKDAEMNAKFEVIESIDDQLVLQTDIKKIRLLREDTADLIDALRSRLSFLKQEKDETKI